VSKRIHVYVSGRVQGVFFRAECANQARDRSVGGFVRNLPDGRVEAVFEGSERAVDELVEWCSHGTSWARVEAVEAIEEAPSGEADFRVR
jgi:acylphosphatase